MGDEIEEMNPVLLESLQQQDFEAFEKLAENEHTADIAAVLIEVEPDIAAKALQELSIKKRAETFGYLPAIDQVDIAEHLSVRSLAALMNHMSHDERADLLLELPEETSDKILWAMAAEEREDIRRLASYEDGTAGAIMTTDYAILKPEYTVEVALEKLRREALDKETINRAYVVNCERKLLGALPLRSLILAKPRVRIEDIMESTTPSVHVNDLQEQVAQKIAKYDLIALPVVDDEGRLIGIVTHDDAIDVFQEEATEDFHKSSSIGEFFVNISEASLGLIYRKRIMWLVLLVFGNIFTGMGISLFENIISSHVALVFFMPLLIGSSGNAGSQSATLMIRALATGDLVLKDWGRMLLREFVIAGALGITMAVAVSSIGYIRGGVEIAAIVSLTMILVVMIGSLIGMSLPFVLSRLKLDPASASAPLITSIADAVGVIIYFSIATHLLGFSGAG
jgi:magnesium transporter